MTIEELFGTLQQSIIGAWRKHLRTSKYSKHMALDEFYTEMPEKVDALIEAWMGVNGRKPKSFDNLLSSKNLGTLDYLTSLRKVVKDGYILMEGEPELEACMDDIAELIDSTIYKIKELKENKNMKELKDYINESLNEAKTIPGIGRKSFDDIAMAIFDEGDNNGEDWSEQLEDNDVYDVLEYWAAFEDIAKKLRVDAGELRDWVMANEEALKEYLMNA